MVRDGCSGTGCFLAALCLGLFSTPLHAQRQPWEQLISGVVKDSTDRPITGALVWVPGTPFATRTNVYGEFFFDTLPEGLLSLRAELVGYLPARRDNVRIDRNVPLTLEFELRHDPDPELARRLTPAVITSKGCFAERIQPVTDTVPGHRPPVLVIANCNIVHPASPWKYAGFTFPRSGHLLIRDHKGWERLLRNFWQPDSTGAAPIQEPDWRQESLILLSIHASGGCGWSSFLHLAGGDAKSITLELFSDFVLPCQRVVRDVYLLRVTRPKVKVVVRENTEWGSVGLAEELSR
jgi:hypothetical protein